MDVYNASLKQLLDTLSKNNGQADWNMYQNKSRKIVVKISFDEILDPDDINSDMNLDTAVTFGTRFRKISNAQCRRNHLRAKSHTKKRRLSESTEKVRNVSYSESDPDISISRCYSTESPTRSSHEKQTVCSESLIQSSPEVSLMCPLNQSVMCKGSSDAKEDISADMDQVAAFSISDKTDFVYLDVKSSINDTSNFNERTPRPF